MSKRHLLSGLIFFLFSLLVHAREIHVTKTGNDGNSGDAQKPLLTINKAAQIAQPGDIVGSQSP